MQEILFIHFLICDDRYTKLGANYLTILSDEAIEEEWKHQNHHLSKNTTEINLHHSSINKKRAAQQNSKYRACSGTLEFQAFFSEIQPGNYGVNLKLKQDQTHQSRTRNLTTLWAHQLSAISSWNNLLRSMVTGQQTIINRNIHVSSRHQIATRREPWFTTLEEEEEARHERLFRFIIPSIETSQMLALSQFSARFN